MEITPCNPGFGASCALCCGSHNYKATYETIDAMFHDRSTLFKVYSREYIVAKIRASRSNLTGSYYFHRESDLFPAVPEPVVDGGAQCPFLGYLETTRIGCLLSREKDDACRRDCFYQYGGKHFICDAFHELSGEDIEYAARLTGDWRFYSILIHAPDFLKTIRHERRDPEMVPHDEMMIKIKDTLLQILHERSDLHRIHRYFS